MSKHLYTVSITKWKGGDISLSLWSTEVPHAILTELAYLNHEWIIRVYE